MALTSVLKKFFNRLNENVSSSVEKKTILTFSLYLKAVTHLTQTYPGFVVKMEERRSCF
jgi:hypothetical protein